MQGPKGPPGEAGPDGEQGLEVIVLDLSSKSFFSFLFFVVAGLNCVHFSFTRLLRRVDPVSRGSWAPSENLG